MHYRTGVAESRTAARCSWEDPRTSSLLLKRIEEIAALTDARGLLVKLQHQAVGFFVRLGFNTLPVEDDSRDYPYRLWKRFS
jgi:hypothetical protein